MSEEEKAIQFYKKFIDAEEQELEWMYKEDEEYYKNDIEQKELLIKGWKSILNIINNLQKEIEKKEKRLNRQLELLNKQEKQISQALETAFDYGQSDGEHHKAWVIDQMVRALTGKKYDKWINDYMYDEETRDSYTWDKGIAP